MPTRELEIDEMKLVIDAMNETPLAFMALNQEHHVAHFRIDEHRKGIEQQMEELRAIEWAMLKIAKTPVRNRQ